MSNTAETDETEAALGLLLPSSAGDDLRRFCRYMLSLRNGGIFGRYRDLDPVSIPWALSSIFVVERLGNAPFAYRLAGEQLHTRMAPALKGKTAFDIFEPSYAEWTENRWCRSADEGLACYVHTRHETSRGRQLQAERILFPMLDQYDDLKILVGMSNFDVPLPEPGLGSEERQHRQMRWTAMADLPGAA